MSDDKRKDNGNHPNSLKHLQPWTKERAQAAQKKSVEARHRNTAAREAMAEALQIFRKLKIEEIPPAIDVLRINMAKAIQDDDLDEAARMAMALAPYESAKLAAQDINVTSDVSDKTDAELEALLKEFGKIDEEEELH